MYFSSGKSKNCANIEAFSKKKGFSRKFILVKNAGSGHSRKFIPKISLFYWLAKFCFAKLSSFKVDVLRDIKSCYLDFLR